MKKVKKISVRISDSMFDQLNYFSMMLNESIAKIIRGSVSKGLDHHVRESKMVKANEIRKASFAVRDSMSSM